MRSKSDPFQPGFVRLAVNQNEIGPDVAVAVIAPFSRQGVIEETSRRNSIVGKEIDRLR
jgi:hypothetical protein